MTIDASFFQGFREFAQRKFYTPITERRHFFLCTVFQPGCAIAKERRLQPAGDPFCPAAA
jgi:hypothetical protein